MIKRMDEAVCARVWAMIRDLHFGTLATVDPDGRICSRPVVLGQHDFDGALWFDAAASASIARAIVAHPAVAISFASQDGARIAALSGVACLVKDAGQMRRMAQVRFDVHHAEAWDGAAGRMMTLFSQPRRPIGLSMLAQRSLGACAAVPQRPVHPA